MSWKLFVGASILSAGVLLKIGASIVPVAAGVMAAAVLHWRRQRTGDRTILPSCSALFRYEIHKSALTYGMLLVVVATFLLTALIYAESALLP